MDLKCLGWDDNFQKAFEELRVTGFRPGRVAREDRERYNVIIEDGEITAQLSGRFIHRASSRDKFPAVGDWVVMQLIDSNQRGVIQSLLPRRSFLSRKAVLAGGPKYGPGRTEEQILAANIDVAFLVSGLDEEFNVRRIERYLAVAWDSGAEPVILLNKADLCDEADIYVDQVAEVAIGVAIHVISAKENSGLEEIEPYLASGRTGVFLGSSGVGKSSIINLLMGENRQKVNTVSDFKSRGRHTTTAREMIVFPSRGIVIDTPGIRELQLWGEENSLAGSFEDVEALAEKCRFRDCRHQGEPGCAVRQAIRAGQLDEGRWQNYLKLQKELQHLARRRDLRAQQLERDKWKKITRQMRGYEKGKFG